MILVVGDRADPVIERVHGVLQGLGCDTVHLDAGQASQYSVLQLHDGPSRGRGWRIVGGECRGERKVGAVFIRSGPAGRTGRRSAALFRAQLDRMLMLTTCRVVNRPSVAAGNYAKCHQLIQLGRAGFVVPRTLVTAIPRTALEFIVEHGGRVLVKGLSSVKTIPEVVGPPHLRRLGQLEHCPAQFQEIIHGVDVRLTVVGARAIASVTDQAGAVRSVDACEMLASDWVQRCIDFTQLQGLVVSGFDLRLPRHGQPCVFEMNPNPLVSHYETAEQPLISHAICDELLASAPACSDILA